MEASQRKPSPVRRAVVRRAIVALFAGALLSVLVAGLFSWGRSVQRPRGLFDAEHGRWLERAVQPGIAVPSPTGRLAMQWQHSAMVDVVSLRCLSEKEWKDWGNERFPDASRAEEFIQAARESRGDEGFRSEWAAFADCGAALRVSAPSWAYLPSSEGVVIEILVETVAYGWPFRVLRCRGALMGSPTAPSEITGTESTGLGCFENPWVDHPAWGVAWQPIWPSLLLSAALYGAALWIVVRVPVTIRVWRRKRRGACTNCGYSLAGDFSATDQACPECGRRG